MFEIELVIAWRKLFIDDVTLFACFSPLRVETKQPVAERIGRAGCRRGELNLQISGARPGRHSVFEGERGLIESHLLDQRPKMGALKRRMDASRPGRVDQPVRAVLIRHVRPTGRRTDRCQSTRQDTQQKKGQQRLVS